MAKKQNTPCCSFCGRPADMSDGLIPSATNGSTYICTECVEAIDQMLKELKHEAKNDDDTPQMANVPKPSEICAFLDQYVIGQ